MEKGNLQKNSGINIHIRDTNSKDIFKNPIMCAQFLRDNIDFPLLKDVQPEDIEDVTDHFFTLCRDSGMDRRYAFKGPDSPE